MKIFGAVLLLCGCGGIGIMLCHRLRQLEGALRQLVQCLQWMSWELRDRMPPLSRLCKGAAEQGDGAVCQVFDALSRELDAQLLPDADACMAVAVAAVPRLPAEAAQLLLTLGKSMGRFDLEGQLSGMESVAAAGRQQLQALLQQKPQCLRNYQTLSLCAGVALVILFL